VHEEAFANVRHDVLRLLRIDPMDSSPMDDVGPLRKRLEDFAAMMAAG